MHDYARQLECSEQYLVMETYYRFEVNLKVVTKNNLRSSARGLLFILRTLSEEINFSKCTISSHKNSLGKSIWSYTEVPHGIGTN